MSENPLIVNMNPDSFRGVWKRLQWVFGLAILAKNEDSKTCVARGIFFFKLPCHVVNSTDWSSSFTGNVTALLCFI